MAKHVTAFTALALSLSVAPSAYAAAFTADSVGGTTTVTFSNNPGPGLLELTATLTVDSISSTSLVLTIELSNDTSDPAFTNAGLAAFGFSVDPNATSAAVTTPGSVFAGAELESIPNLALVEVCTFEGVNDQGNDCAGGGQGSLLAMGDNDTFVLTLGFAGPGPVPPSFTLDNFGVKFQTNEGSFEFYSDGPGPGPGPGGGPGPGVPEPALLSLLGAGLAVLAYRARRRT